MQLYQNLLLRLVKYLEVTHICCIFAPQMKTNALSLANYFLELAKNGGKEIKPLKLIKLVYMAYGFSLAVFGKKFIDPRFDRVEAWKYGPVIPSVYHSFKHYQNSPIDEKAVVLTDEGFKEATLDDEQAKAMCQFVWKRYGLKYSDSDLVTLLHKDGTPWKWAYKEGQNEEIPDLLTYTYYKKLWGFLTGKNNG